MKTVCICILSFISISFCSQCPAGVWTDLAAEQYVQANGSDIVAGTYSVPSFVDFNSDGLKDLVVGEKQSYPSIVGKVRVYLNSGTESEPEFSSYYYIQSGGSDLEVVAQSCMGCFPRVVQWDSDGKKDLIVGLSNGAYDGSVMLYLNVGTDEAPVFDSGRLIEYGPAGSKTPINVGIRATPAICDFNSDSKKDLLIGNFDGSLEVYINEGTDTEPNFITSYFVQDNGENLFVDTYRASPTVADLNNDGKKDILTGDSVGQMRVYTNVGTDQNPTFSGYYLVEAGGAVIDLPSYSPTIYARSRPFLCDWTNDGYIDVLVGSSDGKISLFEGLPYQADTEPDGDVDMDDFIVLSRWWMQADCSSSQDCCGADMNTDGIVDVNDLEIFSEEWILP